MTLRSWKGNFTEEEDTNRDERILRRGIISKKRKSNINEILFSFIVMTAIAMALDGEHYINDKSLAGADVTCAQSSQYSSITNSSQCLSDAFIFTPIKKEETQIISDFDQVSIPGEENKEAEEGSDPCVNTHELCDFWAESGECNSNPNYMLVNCKKSCDVCAEKDLDTDRLIANFDMGEAQVVEGIEEQQIHQIIDRSKKYLRNKVLKNDELYAKVRKDCKNQHKLCAFWASTGECNNNPGYMKISCALACRSCENLDFNIRCPLDPNAVDALQPGDLNKMFERITDENSEYVKYQPVIHSRPYVDPKDEGKAEDELDYKIGPWLITFDSFLSDDEADRLITLGRTRGYERSTNVGRMMPGGQHERVVDETRTSYNTWCENECYDDPINKQVVNRIAAVTGIPEANQEYLQMLKYEVGQFYTSHHDMIETHVERQPGPRILTFYMYLNDVEKGGGTKFTDLDIIVTPKKGRAALWPSVLDSDPNKKEDRTHHAALSVEAGVKYGANAWIHLRDLKTALAKACV